MEVFIVMILIIAAIVLFIVIVFGFLRLVIKGTVHAKLPKDLYLFDFFRCKQILEIHFPWYNTLSSDEKKVFIDRVSKFMSIKQFVGVDIAEVKFEMKVLISATAIQLTFGFEEFWLPKLKGFRVYPSIFYSKSNEQYHRGNYNLQGVISLSYEHFLEGNENQTDGRNLGLHEMAHALMFDNQISIRPHRNILAILKACMESVKNKNEFSTETDENFLRKYATNNLPEFFAVCVENFFERPNDFYQILPDVYRCFCILIKQNPLKNSKPTIESFETIKEPVFITKFDWDAFLSPIVLSVLGLFICFGFNLGFGFAILCALLSLFIYLLPPKALFFENGILIKSRITRKKRYIHIQNICFLNVDIQKKGHDKLFIHYIQNENFNIIEIKNVLFSKNNEIVKQYCEQHHIICAQ